MEVGREEGQEDLKSSRYPPITKVEALKGKTMLTCDLDPESGSIKLATSTSGSLATIGIS